MFHFMLCYVNCNLRHLHMWDRDACRFSLFASPVNAKHGYQHKHCRIGNSVQMNGEYTAVGKQIPGGTEEIPGQWLPVKKGY